MSATTKQRLQNAITKNHNDKMENMQSLSTSCMCNPICQARHNTGDELYICKHCYSFRMLKRFKALREKLERNTELLTTCEITADDVPQINASLFRFEAFGEIQNALQVKNYFTIAESNKQTTFALWTKNLFIIDDAIEKYGTKKPDNMFIIYSEPYMNMCLTSADVRTLKSEHPYVDKVFTVHNKQSVLPDELVNCGSRKCIDCRLFYSKNNVSVINEKLK